MQQIRSKYVLIQYVNNDIIKVRYFNDINDGRLLTIFGKLTDIDKHFYSYRFVYGTQYTSVLFDIDNIHKILPYYTISFALDYYIKHLKRKQTITDILQ